MAAGVAALNELQKPDAYSRLDAMAQRLTEGLRQVFNRAEVPSTINRVGSMFTGFFNPGPVETLVQVEQSDVSAYGRYFHAMLDGGVYLAPSQFEAGFISLAHTEDDIDRTIAAAEEALAALS